jgi:16S rRNA (cytosine967-C5)-methyltransferase
MSRYYSYLNTATVIIENYEGATPMAIHLKKYFNASKKHGSKDRKLIASLVYSYFRVAKALPNYTIEEKLIYAHYLCESNFSKLLEATNPELNSTIIHSIIQKANLLGIEINNLFPFAEYLIENLDFEKFALSFLKQPDLFLRIRPIYNSIVIDKLETAQIEYNLIAENCLALANTTKIDEHLVVGEEVIIQDYSSQRVGVVIKKYFEKAVKPIKVWDCCAASGGKSIMMYDFNHSIELTVSDIRQSVLDNLKERFKLAGIKKFDSFECDLSKPIDFKQKFEIIVADVPCTGSGTWARTPEQMYFFEADKIDDFQKLQFSIVKNASKQLLSKGIFIYITCSVFKNENDVQVTEIEKKLGLKLLEKSTLPGYEIGADTMFVAIFEKG